MKSLHYVCPSLSGSSPRFYCRIFSCRLWPANEQLPRCLFVCCTGPSVAVRLSHTGGWVLPRTHCLCVLKRLRRPWLNKHTMVYHTDRRDSPHLVGFAVYFDVSIKSRGCNAHTPCKGGERVPAICVFGLPNAIHSQSQSSELFIPHTCQPIPTMQHPPPPPPVLFQPQSPLCLCTPCFIAHTKARGVGSCHDLECITPEGEVATETVCLNPL